MLRTIDLGRSSVVQIPAQPVLTTSRHYFKEVGIKSFGDNFKAQFLGQKVGTTKLTEITIRPLEQGTSNAPVLWELCGDINLTITQFSWFLSRNRKSTEWFVTRLTGECGGLWVVNALWYPGRDGWRIDADL